MNPNAQTLNVALRRNTKDEPWGFRLQGGIDFKTPLSVQTVNPGGVAERCGLQPSDAVLSINNNPCECMEHDEAKRYLIMANTDVNLVVQRGALNVWKPKVTPLAELRSGPQQNYASNSGEPFVQRTSLAADKQDPLVVGSAHNRTARPFAGFGGPSSVGAGGAGFGGQGDQGFPGPGGPGYGNQQAQAAGQFGGYQQGPAQGEGGYGGPGGQGYGGQHNMAASDSSSGNDKDDESQNSLHAPVNIPGFRSVSPSFLSSPAETTNDTSLSSPDGKYSCTDYKGRVVPVSGAGTGGPASMPSGMKSVRAPVFDASKVQQQVVNHPVCKACNSQIIGVFVKVRGEPFHPACFKCFTCEKNLKNQGYYEYDGQLYCDSHGPASTQ